MTPLAYSVYSASLHVTTLPIRTVLGLFTHSSPPKKAHTFPRRTHIHSRATSHLTTSLQNPLEEKPITM